MRNSSSKFRGLFVILGAFVINLTFGIVSMLSRFQLDMVIYMSNYSSIHRLVNQGQTIWIIGVMTFGMGISMSLGQCLESKIGPSMTVLFGGWIFSFSTCMLYFTVKSYLSVVIICYGLIGGIGMGLAYGVLLSTPAQWFPNRRGLVFGIVLSGCTFYGITFDRLQSKLISGSIQNLPISFVFLGTIYAGIQFIGSIVIKGPPPDIPEDLENNSSSGKWEINETSFTKNIYSLNDDNEVELKPHQLILELDFWILWMIFFINSFWIYFITATYSKYSRILGSISDHHIHLVGPISSCLGKIFWGFLIDITSFKRIMLIITICSSVFIGIFNVIPHIDEQFHDWFLAVCVGAIFFFNSGNSSVFPAMCAKLFGMKNFVFNYGMLFTSVTSSHVICSGVVKPFLEDSENFRIEFRNIIFIGCALSLLAALITIFFRGKSLIIENV